MDNNIFMDSSMLGNYHDIDIGVAFANKADAKHLTSVLVGLSQSLTTDFVAELDELALEGVINVHGTDSHLKICLRFSSKPTDDYEYVLHQRAHYIMYLFAKIDTLFLLGSTPFPDDFRRWLADFSDYYGLD